MRTQCLTAFAALAAGVLPCAVKGTQLAVSADCAYALDTVKDWPRAIKTAEDLSSLRLAVYKKGDTLTTTAPDGTVTTATKSLDTVEALPINAGGLWAFANDRQKGEASFTVRHSIYGTLGDGTDASPAKLVDADELSDLVNAGTAGSGYVFTLNGVDSLLDLMTLPAGFCMERRSNGTYRIVTSENGSLFTWAEISYALDSRRPGPVRTAVRSKTPPVAYSGDNWIGDASKAVTLRIVSPEHVETVLDLSGTGATPFVFDRLGTWTVQMEMANGTTLETTINVFGGFTITFY